MAKIFGQFLVIEFFHGDPAPTLLFFADNQALQHIRITDLELFYLDGYSK